MWLQASDTAWVVHEKLHRPHLHLSNSLGLRTGVHADAPGVLATYFANTAYVRVKRNEIRVRHIESGTEETFEANPPFTTTRLLIGEFLVAESLLKRALRQVSKRGALAPAPHVVIQPLEMLEGGLSEVEDRVLREIAAGAGASKVVVWVGPMLSDAEVKAKLDA